MTVKTFEVQVGNLLNYSTSIKVRGDKFDYETSGVLVIWHNGDAVAMFASGCWQFVLEKAS